LFTFCPPGPEERMKEKVSSFSGMVRPGAISMGTSLSRLNLLASLTSQKNRFSKSIADLLNLQGFYDLLT
jgi:hypothetical protein